MKKRYLMLSALVAMSAMSVVQAEEAGAKVERIEVTGSRINRGDMETASPVTQISAADIAAGGYTSIQDILSAQSSMSGTYIGSTTNNGGAGKATVNMRGLGAGRTLVLLDGRRMVASGTGADSSVDLNTIPISLIERIEVLKDGASAVYGSDAIAGVVNIITKKDFQGLQLNAQTGMTSYGDNKTHQFSTLMGTEVAGGNLMFGLSRVNRGQLIQSDRPFVAPGASSTTPIPAIIDGDGNYYGVDGKAKPDRYDFTKDSFFATPMQQTSAFSKFVTDINDNARLSADVMFTRKETNQQMAAAPVKLTLDVCDGTNVGKCADLIVGPKGVPVENDTFSYAVRMNAVGPRAYSQQTDTVRASVGVDGALDMMGGLDYTVSYTYGDNSGDDVVDNYILANKMIAAIYAKPNSYASIDWGKADVGYTDASKGGNRQHVVNAGVSGTAFTLPAGDVGFASGIEYRKESGYYIPDMMTQTGAGSTPKQSITEGGYNVYSVYTELAIPVFEDFNLETAVRFDKYNTYGNSLTYKVGATYDVIESIKLRSVYATGFRAPNVSELFGGATGSYEYLDDPFQGAAQLDAQLLVIWEAGLDLKPEESKSFTAGVVFEAPFGASMTLDYWKLDVTDAISRTDAQKGLDNCFKGDVAACATINVTPSGDISKMATRLVNAASESTDGIDLNINYNFEAFALTHKLNIDATYLMSYESDGTDYLNKVDSNFGSFAERKANGSYTLAGDNWNVRYGARFIGTMKDTRKADVAAVWYHDVSGTLNVNDSVSITLGVNNVTDQSPRLAKGAIVAETYDVIGRTFYLGTTVTF